MSSTYDNSCMITIYVLYCKFLVRNVILYVQPFNCIEYMMAPLLVPWMIINSAEKISLKIRNSSRLTSLH